METKREESASGFRKETVNKILHLHFKDDKTREAAARGARQAQGEDLDRVDIEHVEKVLPQLALGLCISEVMFSGLGTPFTPMREGDTNINSSTNVAENQRQPISTGSHNRLVPTAHFLVLCPD
ncbi:centromere protein X isoform X3 [Emydura macquarii macquarii]|uniref:centromere protein X isoform X3 n=1 Tax=Emydura macquarii macquarii TaxID=1129001 RepID=UPI00352B1C5C